MQYYGILKNKAYTQVYSSYAGSRRNLIRYNSPQARVHGKKQWLCVKIAWLEVFAHEKPACALYM